MQVHVHQDPSLKNIYLAYVYTAFASVASALSGLVSSNYLFDVSGKSNLAVGVHSAIASLLQFLTALPIGYVADRLSKATLLKFTATSLLAGIVATALPLVLDLLYPSDPLSPRKPIYYLLLCAGAVIGIVNGMLDPPFQSLLILSTRNTHHLLQVSTTRFTLSLLGAASGPLLGSLLFWKLGNEWSQSLMASIWLSSLMPLIASASVLARFKDVPFVTNVSESRPSSSDPLLEPTAPLLPFSHASAVSIDNTCSSTIDKVWWIPILCAAADVFVALGSGMTVKFWALFYRNEMNFSPVRIGINLSLECLSCALFANFLQKVGPRIGKMRLTVCCYAAGICVLTLVVFNRAWWRESPNVVVALLIARMVFINAPTPFLATVLAHHVEPKAQGRWASRTSMSTFGWAGSAAFGGWICDNYGYGFTFVITAMLHACGTLCLIPILLKEF